MNSELQWQRRLARAHSPTIAFLDNRAETWNGVMEGVPVLGPLGLAQERRAHAAILSLADLGNEDAAELLHDLNFPRLIVVRIWAASLGPEIEKRDREEPAATRNHALKRRMDRAVWRCPCSR
jgi:hypothetical protein